MPAVASSASGADASYAEQYEDSHAITLATPHIWWEGYSINGSLTR